LSFISWLISKLASWILTSSSSDFLKSIMAGLTTTGDANAQIAVEQIRAEIAQRQIARDIRLATSGFPEMRLITFVIASCFTTHLVAVSLDTTFKLGMSIPAYPAPFDQWEGVILLSFFGVQASVVAIRSIAAAVLSRASK
jgi:hypothetical protein